MRREAAVTLFRIGAVQFSEQRIYDHREVRLHLVCAKVHCHSSEKLKDAGSLEIQIGFDQKYFFYTWCHTIHLENKGQIQLQFWIQKFLGTWEDH